MNLKTRIKMYFKFFGYVLFNVGQSIAIIVLYALLFPFCMASSKIMTQAMKDIKKGIKTDNLSVADEEALELLKELLLDYRATLKAWTSNVEPYGVDIFKDPSDRWAVNETIKYLEKHNIKIGE